MITLDEIRSELQRFAEETLQYQLSNLAEVQQKAMCNELQRIVPGSLQSHQISPSVRNELRRIITSCLQECQLSSAANMPQTLREAATPSAEQWHLPGQPSELNVGEISAALPSSHADTDLNNKQSALSTESQSKLFKSDSKLELHPHYRTAKSKVQLFHTAVAPEPSTAQHLRDLGYFHPRSPRSFHRSDATAGLSFGHRATAKDDAKQVMLRDSHEESFISDPGSPKSKQFYSSSRKDLDNLADKDACIVRVVFSPYFEYCIAVIVLLNSIFVGVTLEAESSDPDGTNSALVQTFEVMFLIAFAVELGLRMFVYRCQFFKCNTPSGETNQDIVWNISDTIIFVLHALELIAISLSGNLAFTKFSLVRVVRILKVFRLMRLVKFLRMFRSLRIMASAMLHSFMPFVWGLLSLLLVSYTCAALFTEVLLGKDNLDDDSELKKHFGSMSDSWLSLLKAVSGGIDWGDLAEPLKEESVFVFVLFLVYLFFVLLALMNVFTSIFLEQVSEMAKHENEVQLVQSAFTIFKASDHDDDDIISLDEFQTSLKHPEVNSFFQAINFDKTQAQILFELLDASGDKTVSCNEFIRGCLRLRGAAKGLDLLILSREVHQLIDALAEMSSANAASITSTLDLMHQLLLSRTGQTDSEFLSEQQQDITD